MDVTPTFRQSGLGYLIPAEFERSESAETIIAAGIQPPYCQTVHHHAEVIDPGAYGLRQTS